MLLRNLYDSHVHLLSTGQVARVLDLSKLKSLEDLRTLEIRPENRRAGWLVGFGWDENRWTTKTLPTRIDLDLAFPGEAVYFSRCDGHSGVTSTEGLRRLGLLDRPVDPIGGQVLLDTKGVPNGRLTETAHYQALEKLPRPSRDDLREDLISGMRKFNEAGFTHVRDMAGSEELWGIALDLEKQGLQTLCIEWNFSCETREDFERALSEASRARLQETPLNKVAGIKLYFDGSLGSDTAFLSRPYAHRSDGARGITCWPEDHVEQVLRKAWENGLPVAVHTIGDEAADRIVEMSRKISSSGLGGRLNLEHAQVLRTETIQKMKGLHVTCHLQPCHWLNDRRWLENKLGSLAKFAFPWEALRRQKIPFFFGSDSPIESMSLFDNLRALRESVEAGIPRLDADPILFHTKTGSADVRGETLIDDEKILEVRLNGKVIFPATS